MKIQLIGGQKKSINVDTDIIWTTLSAPRSLDEFDVNIIDLTSELIWRNNGADPTSLNCINDFMSIQKMVEKKNLSKVIYQLPQNAKYLWSRVSYSSAEYYHGKPLKDMIDTIYTLFMPKLLPHGHNVPIIYENTRTTLNGLEYCADFYFDTAQNVVTKSLRSQKSTTILFRGSDIYATTLNISTSQDHLKQFLTYLFKTHDREPVPEWVKDIVILDDQMQNGIISDCQNEINIATDKIASAEAKLTKNAEYKSILYTNGSELVRVVFNILEQLLSCDLSGFIDEKKEDFLIQKATCTFVGEIKGVTSNVKNEHISQVDVHYQGYLDKLSEAGQQETVRQILIINPFRTKPITEREPVHEQQITLAVRNGCLIVTTDTLLHIFEKFCQSQISSEQCIATFSKCTGLLSLNDFESPTPEELESFKV